MFAAPLSALIFLAISTSDINKFKWSAREYNYDSQAYIYEQLFGKPLIFLVIDKQKHSLGMFEPTQEFLERGERKVEQAEQEGREKAENEAENGQAEKGEPKFNVNFYILNTRLAFVTNRIA